MTPEQQGYARCDRCKRLRPERELQAGGFGATSTGLVCTDVAWCSAQAGVGKGELTGGAP